MLRFDKVFYWDMGSCSHPIFLFPKECPPSRPASPVLRGRLNRPARDGVVLTPPNLLISLKIL